MKGTGILLNEDYDLKIQKVVGADGKIAGGLVVGNTLYQNQALLLGLNPGELKLDPLVGVGIESALLDGDFAHWSRLIRLQLDRDGQKVKSVRFTNNKNIIIDAAY